MSVNVNGDFITRTLADLVGIESINPSLSPEGSGEEAIGAYVANVMSSIGLRVTVDELAPGRVNVVGVLPGSGNGRSLLLNAHMDTVGVAGMTIDPFGAAIRDGRLYGRGAQDMKGSLAAMLGAARALADAGVKLGGDLVVTAVADEEYASLGTDALVKSWTADAAIVTEPTDMRLCRAHRGFVWFDVETHGRAAHGSRFNEGIDANMRMGRFLAQLDELEQGLRRRPPHPLAGPPSLHAAILQGGSEISVYAAHCLLKVERRTIPGETVAGTTAELHSIIDRLAAADPTFRATLTATFSRQPFEIAADRPLVRTLDRALAQRLGESRPHSGQTFWTDAAILAAAGIDSVLLGPVGAGLHSAEEWVDIASVVDLAAVLADTAVAFCAPTPD